MDFAGLAPPDSPSASFSPGQADDQHAHIFVGSGEMRARCDAFDWGASLLGPTRRWSASLRTTASLVLGATFPMVLLWGDSLVQIYNDGYRELMGLKHPAGLGQPTRECWPEVWHINAPIYERVLAGESLAFDHALYPITRSGTLEDAWFTLGFSPVRNDVGVICGVLVTVMETTAEVHKSRLEAERMMLLAAAEDRATVLSAIFSNMSDGVYVGTMDGITLANAEALHQLGYSLPEELNRDIPTLAEELQTRDPITLRRLATEEEPFVRAFLGGERVVRDVLFRHRLTGEDRILSCSASPVRGPDGTIVAAVAVNTDVTAQRRIGEERERLLGSAESARADADAANAAKSAFLTVMSHELRTPLNAIGGYAQLLEMGIRGPVTEQQHHDLARIQMSQQHLLGLINGVLSFAKIDAGALTYSATDVSVDEVLKLCEALVAPDALARKVALSFPTPDSCHVARADRDQFLQIMLNLIGNAIKFTEAGGSVSVECDMDTDRCMIVRVRDTGRGIVLADLDRVFHPFVQVDSTLTRTQPGTGLGLTISRALARGMGGELSLESVPGVGSTFTLRLPVG
ncbi:MAG: PAS domain-containing sensor histidine kinase [Gemmatimonadaceae bacterium]